MDQPKTVQCINCGFASKVTGAPTPEYPNRLFCEITAKERQSAIAFTNFKIFNSAYGMQTVGTALACSRGVFDLGKLVRERTEAGTPLAQAALDVLKEERQCSEWCKHRDGLTPKDHLDQRMFEELSQRIEDDRKEFMRELEKQRQAFDVKMAERAEQFHRETSSIGRKLMWAAVILGVCQLLASFLAMTPDARLMRWLHPKTEIVQPVAPPAAAPEPSSPQ